MFCIKARLVGQGFSPYCRKWLKIRSALAAEGILFALASPFFRSVLMLSKLLVLATLVEFSASAQRETIGVFTLFHPVSLQVQPAGSTIVISDDNRTPIILTGERGHVKATFELRRGQILLDGAPAAHIRVTARDGSEGDFILAVPGRIARRYRGMLTVSSDGAQLIPVVSMNIEIAVASIVSAESPPGAGLEALKAQAVVTRSFIAAGPRHRSYDFCDTTHCQFLRSPPAPDSPAARAAKATQGLILTWHGQPLAAMYSGRCGGKTLSLRDLGIAAKGYPYFSVECAYCLRHPAQWERKFSAVEGAQLVSHSEIGRLALAREHGWAALPSNQYQVQASSNEVVVSGRGQGHGIGLCQYGAAGMAAEGATFDEILRHYYPETAIGNLSDTLKSLPN